MGDGSMHLSPALDSTARRALPLFQVLGLRVVCVCERERESERRKSRERKREDLGFGFGVLRSGVWGQGLGVEGVRCTVGLFLADVSGL